MTACKVLADEYEMASQTDLATDLRKDAASMRLAVMAPRKRVGMRLCGAGFQPLRNGWQLDQLPRLQEGAAPVVRVKAMATGKSAEFCYVECHRRMRSLARQLSDELRFKYRKYCTDRSRSRSRDELICDTQSLRTMLHGPP